MGVCADCVHMGYGEERQILYSHTGHWYGCAGACPAGESGDSFFFLLLSVYLLVKSSGRRGRRGNGSSGAVVCIPWQACIFWQKVRPQTACSGWCGQRRYTVWNISVILHDRSKIRDRFWNCTGMTVFLMMMGAFYSDPSLALWNMILCMAVFAGAYVMLYRSGCSWLHLAAAAAVLPFL